MNKKQSGFGALVLVMALVIVVLLGVVGWLAWDKIQTAKGADAEKFVSTFYEKYTDFGNDRVSLIKQYGTANLLNDWNTATSNPYGVGSDPIVCAQAIAPTSVTGYKVNGSSVDVTVSEAFNTPEVLTIKVVDQNGLKIDHVTCPQR